MAEATKERNETSKTVTLDFQGAALEALEKMALSEGKRLDEIVEDAISLRQWAMGVKENKETVIVRKDRKDRYALEL